MTTYGPHDSEADRTADALAWLEPAPDVAGARVSLADDGLAPQSPTLALNTLWGFLPSEMTTEADENAYAVYDAIKAILTLVEAQGKAIDSLRAEVTLLSGFAAGMDDRTAHLVRRGGIR